jgi:hypothetical protein
MCFGARRRKQISTYFELNLEEGSPWCHTRNLEETQAEGQFWKTNLPE